MERTVELSTVWNRLLAYRRPITIFVAVATLLTSIAVFMLPPWYQATGSLLPPGEEDSSFGIARLLKGVAVPGIKIPTQATPADVFLAVLDSRRIREEIVNSFLTFPTADEFLAYFKATMLYEEGAEKLGVTDDDMRRALPADRDIVLSKEMLVLIGKRDHDR